MKVKQTKSDMFKYIIDASGFNSETVSELNEKKSI